MSQHSENDDSDDEYYFLQPVSNQYNITDKIKEANQELYKGEKCQRSSQPKVRFRDHQLVDYEPEEDEVSVELMEKRSSISILNTISTSSNNNDIIVRIKEEESSDDGYIDEEDEAIPDGERIVVESIEIEEVCEQIELLEMTVEDVLGDDTSTNDDETYTKEDFHQDSIESVIVAANRIKKLRKIYQPKQQPPEEPSEEAQQKRKSTKRVFRSKINPSVDDVVTPTTIEPPTIPSIIEKRATSARTKPCCQNNNEYKQKLPKYNGYSSNYGLSKDELDRRCFAQLRNLEIKQYRTAKKVEQKEYVAKINEEAFAKWLRKKMRHSINKSNPINMYDVKPSGKLRHQQQSKRRQFQRQMETEENDDESSSEVLPEEGDEEI